MNRILTEQDTYFPLGNNLTQKYKKELQVIVDKCFERGILNKKEKFYLIPVAPHIPVIYYLPKVLNNPLNPPGQPIINGIDSVTSRIGRYIDHFLQPLVSKTPSYLKESMQAINILNQIIRDL